MAKCDIRLMFSGRSPEDREKTLVIRLRSKNVYSVDTSLNHMVRGAWDLQAASTRHNPVGVHEPLQMRVRRFGAIFR